MADEVAEPVEEVEPRTLTVVHAVESPTARFEPGHVLTPDDLVHLGDQVGNLTHIGVISDGHFSLPMEGEAPDVAEKLQHVANASALAWLDKANKAQAAAEAAGTN